MVSSRQRQPAFAGLSASVIEFYASEQADTAVRAVIIMNDITGVGGAPPPKKDLHRLVKWPRYVRIQRQRRVLGQRLKVPPALTRFTKTLDKSTAATLFKLLLKYRPEARKEKKERLLKEAESREAGQKVR